jgi:hypothetical protein
MIAGFHQPTIATLAARIEVSVRGSFAKQSHRQEAGRQTLADSGRPGKEQRVGQATGRRTLPQILDGSRLPAD